MMRVGLAALLLLAAPAIASESYYSAHLQTTTNIASGGLTAGDTLLRTSMAQHQTAHDNLFNTQDQWKKELDHNTLLQYERRNLQYSDNAMSNLNSYFTNQKLRLIQRNAMLDAENNAYNASVQFNEGMIKFINQTNVWLDSQSERLDAQNIELMAEVGVLRDGHTDSSGRTFGLTRQRQNSVQRKLIETANWNMIESQAKAERALKEHYIIATTTLRGKKNNADVLNQGLEAHVPTLTAQRNVEQTQKLMETHKKRNMNTRRANYAAQVPALEASRKMLEAKLKTLVIRNARLRELQGELEERRIDVKKDRDVQKWNYVEALLQKNAAYKYSQTMMASYNTAKAARDTQQTALADFTTKQWNSEIRLTDCEENNRFLEQHKLVLNQRNALLRANCWHTPTRL